MIRKWWLWLTGVLALLLLVASVPAYWSLHIQQKIVARIRERHGTDYAVIAMHADGENGFGVNMYAKLRDYAVFSWRAHVQKSTYERSPFHCYHCALLVSDNTTIYRYYWSIRNDDLILDESQRIPAPARPTWRVDPTHARILHGLKVSDHLNADDNRWYDWPTKPYYWPSK